MPRSVRLSGHLVQSRHAFLESRGRDTFVARPLEEDRLLIEGITATSAGAVNAVALAYGLGAGGRKEARKALSNLWRKTSFELSHSPFQPSLFDKMTANFGLEHSPGYVFMEALGYYSSPYQYNPFNYNPLKKLLEVVVDFEHLRAIELRRRHRVVARIPGRACKPMCRPNDCPSPFAPPKIATCAPNRGTGPQLRYIEASTAELAIDRMISDCRGLLTSP